MHRLQSTGCSRVPTSLWRQRREGATHGVQYQPMGWLAHPTCRQYYRVLYLLMYYSHVCGFSWIEPWPQKTTSCREKTLQFIGNPTMLIERRNYFIHQKALQLSQLYARGQDMDRITERILHCCIKTLQFLLEYSMEMDHRHPDTTIDMIAYQVPKAINI